MCLMEGSVLDRRRTFDRIRSKLKQAVRPYQKRNTKHLIIFCSKQEADMSRKGEGYRWEINKAVSYQRSDASVRNISIWWACERDVCRRKWRSAFILKCTTRDDFKNQSGMPGFVAPWSHYQFVSIAIANRSAPCGLLPLGKVPMSAATPMRARPLPHKVHLRKGKAWINDGPHLDDAKGVSATRRHRRNLVDRRLTKVTSELVSHDFHLSNVTAPNL